MAVRIRMKKMGRKHQPFYRICAMDVRAPRDGEVIEELGYYDPLVKETENALVRLTMFIRPPVGTWFGSWRSLGFRSVAFKGANSRYHPGESNRDWVMAQIPTR